MSAHVGVEGDELVVELGGWDRVWSVSRGRRIPLTHVTGARVEAVRSVHAGIRLGGTAVPRRIVCGRYWSRREGWSFWWVRRARNVVVIDLRDQKDRRLVLQTDDPDDPQSLVRALT